MIPSGFPPKEEIARLTARMLLEIRAVHFNAETPFKLASGLPSPTYIDCRKLISYPRIRSTLMDFLSVTVMRDAGFEAFDNIAGGETAGIPFAAMVAEHEERVQRPRVEQLAQRTLRLIGTIFYRALKRWPEHAALIAVAVTRRMSKKVSLRQSPVSIRNHIVAAIEEFLWVETCSELEGALFQLFAEHRSVLPVENLTIDRDLYTRFAQACWEIISEYS